MKISEMYPSKYLSKDDFAAGPQVMTIRTVVREEIKADNGKELKNVVYFTNSEKPLILNRGNAEVLVMAYGDDSTAWHGRQIELYVDPNILFAGKRVGGLRLRMPSSVPSHAPAQSSNGQLFDVSDGKTVAVRQTRAQIEILIAQNGQPASAWKVKLAGAPRETAKPADQYGFMDPLVNQPGDANEDIPF